MCEFDLGYFVFMDSVENRSQELSAAPKEEEPPQDEVEEEKV